MIFNCPETHRCVSISLVIHDNFCIVSPCSLLLSICFAHTSLSLSYTHFTYTYTPLSYTHLYHVSRPKRTTKKEQPKWKNSYMSCREWDMYIVQAKLFRQLSRCLLFFTFTTAFLWESPYFWENCSFVAFSPQFPCQKHKNICVAQKSKERKVHGITIREFVVDGNRKLS